MERVLTNIFNCTTPLLAVLQDVQILLCSPESFLAHGSCSKFLEHADRESYDCASVSLHLMRGLFGTFVITAALFFAVSALFRHRLPRRTISELVKGALRSSFWITLIIHLCWLLPAVRDECPGFTQCCSPLKGDLCARRG